MDKRKNQKVIATLKLEDDGQDFTEIDVLENGVILGDSPIFSEGRLSLLGIGTTDGREYERNTDFIKRKTERKYLKKFKKFVIYFYKTGEKEPVPWKADTFRYDVLEEIKVEKPNRFLKK